MRLFLLGAALALGSLAAYAAFKDPYSAGRVAPTAATVLAVLASVSLAIFSILAAGSHGDAGGGQKQKRISKLINGEDGALVDQNLAIFVVLVLSLMLCLATAFFVPDTSINTYKMGVRFLASAAAFGTGMSLVFA